MISYLFSLALVSFVVFGLVNAYALFLHKDKAGFSFFYTTLLIMEMNIKEFESINTGRLGFILWLVSLPKIFELAVDQMQGLHPGFFEHDFLWAEVITEQVQAISEEEDKEEH